MMLIPLALTSFTHLWNLDGFPLFHADEGTYMRRIFLVMNGIDILEQTGYYANTYYNPFFAQILLGSLLWIIGFPNIAMEQTASSIELAIAFPRMIMALFAIIDTFLVFKICQRAFNIRIAFFAAILFGVTPLTWLMRILTLDTIAMPFLLTSIFISLSLVTWNKTSNIYKHSILILLSGTFLGLAMLTKIPFFTMIPLILYLIYKNSKHLHARPALKMTAICLIPIFLIPSIWPLYAIYVGEFDLFEEGIQDQLDKGDRRSQVVEIFFNNDLVLFFLGFAGLVYSLLRKNWIIVLWIVPFLAFVFIHGWFHHLNAAVLLPALCIAGANFVFEIIQKLKPGKIKLSAALIIIYTIIGGIGFFNTFILINQNLESVAINAISQGLDYSDRADGLDDDKINEQITVIVPTEYSWIFKYVYKMNYTFDTQMDIGPRKIETNKTVILQNIKEPDVFDEIRNKFSSFILEMDGVKKICYLNIEWYKTNFNPPPSVIIKPFESRKAEDTIVFQVNQSNDNNNPERIDMKNTTARFVNITIVGNTEKKIAAAISDLVIYGKKYENDDCKKVPINTINFKDHSLLFDSLENYDIIASYQKLLHDMKEVQTYEDPHPDLNDFTKLLASKQYGPRILDLKANY